MKQEDEDLLDVHICCMDAYMSWLHTLPYLLVKEAYLRLPLLETVLHALCGHTQPLAIVRQDSQPVHLLLHALDLRRRLLGLCTETWQNTGSSSIGKKCILLVFR